MGIFFALATCTVVAVGLALMFPESMMEMVWKAYPARRALLIPNREWLGPGFLALAVAMMAASVGCFLRRKWGWWLALAIFAANGLGDVVQVFLGHYIEGAIGIAAAGAIVFYLSRASVRKSFS